MKKTKTLNALCAIAIALLPNYFYAQTWLLGGNTFAGSNGTNISNLFGTNATNNTPVRFGTNGVNRMKLNQTVSYPVNSSSPTSVRDGFLLLGSANSNLASGGTLYGAANIKIRIRV